MRRRTWAFARFGSFSRLLRSVDLATSAPFEYWPLHGSAAYTQPPTATVRRRLSPVVWEGSGARALCAGYTTAYGSRRAKITTTLVIAVPYGVIREDPAAVPSVDGWRVYAHVLPRALAGTVIRLSTCARSWSFPHSPDLLCVHTHALRRAYTRPRTRPLTRTRSMGRRSYPARGLLTRWSACTPSRPLYPSLTRFRRPVDVWRLAQRLLRLALAHGCESALARIASRTSRSAILWQSLHSPSRFDRSSFAATPSMW